MITIYFDSGTTNTRAYLLRDGRLAGMLSEEFGSKDSALQKVGVSRKDSIPQKADALRKDSIPQKADTLLADSASPKSGGFLLHRLHDLMLRLLEQYGLSPDVPCEIWMSGMVSAPGGVCEIPHLEAPVGLSDLARRVVTWRETEVFDRVIHIIPGVKTSAGGTTGFQTCTRNADSRRVKTGIAGAVTVDNLYRIGNVRGEETEVFGILAEHPELRDHSILLMPGSHTQVVTVKHGAIAGLCSTVTGELYEALRSDTLLSTALGSKESAILPDLVRKGYDALMRFGFNRALYLVRTMELFMDVGADARQSFCEGVLNGGVMQAIEASMNGEAKSVHVPRPVLAVYGSAGALSVYRTLLSYCFPKFAAVSIERGKVPYSVKGYEQISASSLSSPHFCDTMCVKQ